MPVCDPLESKLYAPVDSRQLHPDADPDALGGGFADDDNSAFERAQSAQDAALSNFQPGGGTPAPGQQRPPAQDGDSAHRRRRRRGGRGRRGNREEGGSVSAAKFKPVGSTADAGAPASQDSGDRSSGGGGTEGDGAPGHSQPTS